MRVALTLSALAALVLSACAPAAPPSPTAAPAKPAATTAPAKPAATAAPAKPAASPAAKAAASPAAKAAASPAAKTADKPTAKTETKPAAKAPAFNEQAVADFYRGKTVRIIVGFAPGGGFDTYARTISRHLGKHIPGNPNIIVENMPGAGSLLAANHLYKVAAKDGTVIGNIHGFSFLQDLFDAEGVEFEGDKFGFIGVPGQSTYLCFATDKSGIKSIKEVIGPGSKEIVLGGDAPGSATDDTPAILKESIDLNAKVVPGYGGTSKVRLAMERGEVDGMCGWSWESAKTSNLEDLRTGKIVPLVQITDKPIEDLPNTQNVPLARDLATSDEGRQLMRFGIEDPGKYSRPYLFPPGTPQDRVLALRKAFADTLKDPGLLADAQKAKIDVVEISGERLEQLIKDTFAMPASVRTKLKSLLQP